MLSTLEPSADDAATPRGLLRLGGRSIVHHQLAASLALGCERVICLADGLPGEVISLQHAAERAGASFQVTGDGRAVAQLVKPDDELLVFADGLIASPEAVSTLLGGRSGVVVQPVESGLAAGYERIDLNHAGAGLIRLPGRLAAGLAELPGEWNPVSALLRIAVQSSIRQVVLPQALSDGGRWTLVRSDGEAHRLEPSWLRQHTAQRDGKGPGRWLAARLVEAMGPALLHAGTRPQVVALGAAALALLALGSAWFGFMSFAFAGLGIAWLVRRAAAILTRVHGDRALVETRWLRPETGFDALLDLAFATVAAWRLGEAHPVANAYLVGGFVALVLLGLLRLLPALFAEANWSGWLEDRLVLGLALAAASLSSVFGLALMAAILALLIFALAMAHEARNTPGEAPGDGESADERLTRP
ncbi:hypothetical protein [Novosphingobium sp. Gsoil 351]|uniref:hypothetical protein n=1 Tax=Novosphingobium sp. Gsoil 351 TaxID=2675225 RepID=UPI0018A87827|nr:hypothetical protein [Novosphingobium sp. Gsoil 351]